MAKKVLSVALVLCMFLGIFALDAAAAGVHIAYYEKEYGDIIPVDTKGKAVTTEYLYGARDYLRFTLKGCSAENAVAGIEIYLNENSEEPLASAAFDLSGSGTVDLAAAIEMSVFPKSGTYYAVSYVALIEGDDIYVDYYTFREFKIVVDKSTSNIKKQTVVFTFATTLNGPQIKWYAVKGASKYYVYRKAKDSDPWKKIATLGSSARNYVDKSVAAKTGAYIYTVKAVKSDGTASKYQDIEYIYAAPVKTVSVAETSDNIVNVSWSKAAGVSGYMIYRKTASSGWKKLATVSGASTLKYADKSAKVSGEKYTYTVKAFKNMYGVQHCASFISGTSITFVAAPKLNEITDDANGIKISWEKAPGASKYTVYRSPAVNAGGKATWTKIASVSASTFTYTDKTAASGASYSYTVRSEGASSRGSYASTGRYYLPAAEFTTAAVTYDNKITLKWKVPAGATTIFLERDCSVDEFEEWDPLGDDGITSFVDSSKKVNGKTYKYRVCTYGTVKDANGLEYTDSYKQAIVLVPFLAAPELTSAEADGENVKVVWAPVEGAVSYTIYRKSAASDSWKSVGTVAADGECSFVDTSASAAGNYIYTVRSEGEGFRGSYFNAGITYTPAQKVISAE